MTVHGFPGYQQTDTFPEIIDVLNGNGNTAKKIVKILEDINLKKISTQKKLMY